MNLKKSWYILTHWEQWHYNIKYVLLAPLWIWYSLRARSFYFFAPANPTLYFGGFEGGTKKEIYEHLPLEVYPKTSFVDPSWHWDRVVAAIEQGKFVFPLVVKPNIGMMGLMFRKINNLEQLAIYHRAMKVEYMLQELVTYPLEVSVFYYRMPGEEKGRITGFVRKEALEVVGDGHSSLQQLMVQLEDRPGFKAEEWKAKHQHRLHEIIPQGVVYKLSWTANLSRGARLVSLEDEKDESLLKVFDDLSHQTRHFYYGRYDIKCASVADLKKGQNFYILEFNGAGAEPHHMYGNGNHLFQAFKIIAYHWRVLYQIAKRNKRDNVNYPGLREGLAFTRKANRHFKALHRLDRKTPVFH